MGTPRTKHEYKHLCLVNGDQYITMDGKYILKYIDGKYTNDFRIHGKEVSYFTEVSSKSENLTEQEVFLMAL